MTKAKEAEKAAIETTEEMDFSIFDQVSEFIEQGAPEETEQEKKPAFTISNDSAADWALRKIADEKKEYQRIKDLGDQLIAETQAKIEAAKKRYENGTGYLTSLLAQYFQQVPHKATKTQETYMLLSGKLVMKLGKNKAQYDDDKLVQYLKDNDLLDYVKTKETPAWGEFSKKLDLSSGTTAVNKETGEIVDCITVQRTPDVFSVDV